MFQSVALNSIEAVGKLWRPPLHAIRPLPLDRHLVPPVRIVDNPPAGTLVVVEHVHKNLIPALVVGLTVTVQRRAPERLAEECAYYVRLLAIDSLDNLRVVTRYIHLHGNNPELQHHRPF